MRRKDREMPVEFAYGVADRCNYATLATVNEDGTPYCIPITIAREENKIYFHCAFEGQKITNLKNSADVCISCVSKANVIESEFTVEYESAVINGKAEEITDDEEKIHALRLLCTRHTPNNMEHFDDAIKRSLFRTCIWQITINEITGKAKKIK